MLVLNKRIFFKVLITALILLNIFAINSFAIVDQTNNFYVNDYANLISTSTEQYIINTNLNLYNETGAQIVVVTVQNLEGETIEKYANDLFRKFGIGSKNEDNGVLMLLALEERQFRIEVGYGLEEILPDAKTGRIQDKYIIPYLSQNNWDAGIRNGYNAIIQVIANNYGVATNLEAPIETDLSDEEETLDITPIIILLIFFLLMFLAMKNGATQGHISYHGNGGFYGGSNSYRNRNSYRNHSSSSSRTRRSSSNVRVSFGGRGSSGGGGSSRKF